MFVERLVVGPYQTNCYIFGNEETSSAWIIDPGSDESVIIRSLEKRNVTTGSNPSDHTIGTHHSSWRFEETLARAGDSGQQRGFPLLGPDGSTTSNKSVSTRAFGTSMKQS
jgi:hypothetical protein